MPFPAITAVIYDQRMYMMSLYMINIGREMLTPLFYEDPSYIAWPPTLLFQFLSNSPPPHFHVTSNPHPLCSFCFPVSLAEWAMLIFCLELTCTFKKTWCIFLFYSIFSIFIYFIVLFFFCLFKNNFCFIS